MDQITDTQRKLLDYLIESTIRIRFNTQAAQMVDLVVTRASVSLVRSPLNGLLSRACRYYSLWLTVVEQYNSGARPEDVAAVVVGGAAAGPRSSPASNPPNTCESCDGCMITPPRDIAILQRAGLLFCSEMARFNQYVRSAIHELRSLTNGVDITRAANVINRHFNEFIEELREAQSYYENNAAETCAAQHRNRPNCEESAVFPTPNANLLPESSASITSSVSSLDTEEAMEDVIGGDSSAAMDVPHAEDVHHPVIFDQAPAGMDAHQIEEERGENMGVVAVCDWPKLLPYMSIDQNH